MIECGIIVLFMTGGLLGMDWLYLWHVMMFIMLQSRGRGGVLLLGVKTTRICVGLQL